MPDPGEPPVLLSWLRSRPPGLCRHHHNPADGHGRDTADGFCTSPLFLAQKDPENKSCSTCWHHKFLCLLNPAGCTKLSAFAAQVISVLGIISTDNAPLKLPLHLPQRGLKVPSVSKIQPYLDSRCTVQLLPWLTPIRTLMANVISCSPCL